MKTSLAFSLAAAALLGAASLVHADPPASPTPGVARKGPPGMLLKQTAKVLTPDEQKQFAAAHDKAMEDPAVVAANQDRKAAQQELQDATNKAMVQQDPSVEAILEKAAKPKEAATPPPGAAAKDETAPQAGEPGKRPKRGADQGNLSREEHKKLKDARMSAHKSSLVQAAAEKAKKAQKAFDASLHAAMIKADAGVEALIAKVESAFKEGRARGRKPKATPKSAAKESPAEAPAEKAEDGGMAE